MLRILGRSSLGLGTVVLALLAILALHLAAIDLFALLTLCICITAVGGIICLGVLLVVVACCQSSRPSKICRPFVARRRSGHPLA